MKRYIRLTSLIITLLLLITVMGCAKEINMEINYSIGFSDLSAGYPGEHDLECLVETFNDWSSLRNEREYLSSLDEKYNQEYFENVSLIVYAFTRSNGGGSTEITKVNKYGSQLQVYVEIVSGYIDVVSKGIIVIEVNKHDLSNINDLLIVKTLV